MKYSFFYNNFVIKITSPIFQKEIECDVPIEKELFAPPQYVQYLMIVGLITIICRMSNLDI